MNSELVPDTTLIVFVPQGGEKAFYVDYENNFVLDYFVGLINAEGSSTTQISMLHHKEIDTFYLTYPRDLSNTVIVVVIDGIDCHSSCLECGWLKTSEGCTKCHPGALLVEGECLECPNEGYFFDSNGDCT